MIMLCSQISGNTFANNSGAGVIRLSVSGTGSHQIENNVFVNNTRPNNYGYAMHTITIKRQMQLSLKNNHFDNEDAKYEISLSSYDGTLTDASGCYWGGLEYVNIMRR